MKTKTIFYCDGCKTLTLRAVKYEREISDYEITAVISLETGKEDYVDSILRDHKVVEKEYKCEWNARHEIKVLEISPTTWRYLKKAMYGRNAIPCDLMPNEIAKPTEYALRRGITRRRLSEFSKFKKGGKKNGKS